MTWYYETKGKALTMKQGKELESTHAEADASGYARFFFEDGTSWLSEEPALNCDSIGEEVRRKRPAAAAGTLPAMKRPASMNQKMYSRSYHAALTKFKLENGDGDHEAAKKYARECARAVTG